MRIVILGLLVVVAACDTRITDPGSYGSRQTTTSANTSALIGRWGFSRYFDANGSVHLSTTVWEFSAGGAATRTVYTDNITAGGGDVIVTVGTWSADARTISIRFAGSSVPTTFDYRLEGGALVLGGLTFSRL